MKKISDCCKSKVIEKNNEGTFCSDCGMEYEEIFMNSTGIDYERIKI